MQLPLVLLVLISGAICTPIFTLTSHPSEWRPIERDDDDVSLSFVLKHNNIDDLCDGELLAISDPNSPRYGQHLSRAEIFGIIGPSMDVLHAWNEYLGEHVLNKAGFNRRIEIGADALRTTFSAASVRSLFGCDVRSFEHVESGRVESRPWGEFSLPQHLADSLEFVSGVGFPAAYRHVETSEPNDNDVYVAPSVLSAQYRIPNDAKVTHPNNTQAVWEFSQMSYGSYRQEDLDYFNDQCGLPDITPSHVGPYYPEKNSRESSLDVQYMTAVATGAATIHWASGSWLWDVSEAIFSSPSPPLVSSISWGCDERLACMAAGGSDNHSCEALGINSETWIKRVNAEFCKLGAAGLTIIAASGDGGSSNGCPEYPSDYTFNPGYPSSSPYVTSVGATMFMDQNVGDSKCPEKHHCYSTGPEKPCMWPDAKVTVGGGFSVYGKRVSYQDDAVNAYLNNPGVVLPPASSYNATNRAFPDLSLAGHNYLIAQGGPHFYEKHVFSSIDGTSASAPVFGGMITLLNDVRMTAGKPPLGFLNPLLYEMAAKKPETFTDIKTGSNKCTTVECCQYGYNATSGYDPVTGLGTPVFDEILEYIKSL